MLRIKCIFQTKRCRRIQTIKITLKEIRQIDSDSIENYIPLYDPAFMCLFMYWWLFKTYIHTHTNLHIHAYSNSIHNYQNYKTINMSFIMSWVNGQIDASWKWILFNTEKKLKSNRRDRSVYCYVKRPLFKGYKVFYSNHRTFIKKVIS